MALIDPIQDAVKAVREATALIDDFVKIAGRVTNWLNKRHRAKIARELAGLRFAKDGLRKHLEAVASGKSIRSTATLIDLDLEDTEEDVAGVLSGLRSFRSYVNKMGRLDTVEALESVLSQTGTKAGIRLSLRALAMNIRADTAASKNKTAAKKLIKEIDLFNEKLLILHNTILGLEPFGGQNSAEAK